MKINRLLIAIYVSFSFGCTSTTTENYDERFGYKNKFGAVDDVPDLDILDDQVRYVTIPDDIENRSIRIDTIFNSLRYIQLETADECLINTIDRLYFAEDRVVVVDQKRQGNVFLFSEKGDFISQVGGKGKGPSEYGELRSVAVDGIKKKIYIFDGAKRSIHSYDFEGRWLGSRKAYYYAKDVGVVDDFFVMSQKNNHNLHLPDVKNYQIIISDSTGRIMGKTLSYDHPVYSPEIELYSLSSFNVINNKVLFNPIHTNDIYEISGQDSIRLKYRLDIGRRDFLRELEVTKTKEEWEDAHNVKKMRSFRGMALEAGEYLYVQVSNAGDMFYNMKTRKSIFGNSVSTVKFKEEKQKEPTLPFRFDQTIASTGEQFVAVVYPSELNEVMITQEPVQFKGLNKPVESHDNPILVFYSIK